jgi:hypothetical protein
MHPVGPNQRPKDATIKKNIAQFIPEFWFLIMCYYYIEPANAKMDITFPRPPSAYNIREKFELAKLDKNADDDECIKKLGEKLLEPYVRNEKLPLSVTDIDKILQDCIFALGNHVPSDKIRRVMKLLYQVRQRHNVSATGSRTKRARMDLYVKLVEGEVQIMTLKTDFDPKNVDKTALEALLKDPVDDAVAEPVAE